MITVLGKSGTGWSYVLYIRWLSSEKIYSRNFKLPSKYICATAVQRLLNATMSSGKEDQQTAMDI